MDCSPSEFSGGFVFGSFCERTDGDSFCEKKRLKNVVTFESETCETSRVNRSCSGVSIVNAGKCWPLRERVGASEA